MSDERRCAKCLQPWHGDDVFDCHAFVPEERRSGERRVDHYGHYGRRNDPADMNDLVRSGSDRRRSSPEVGRGADGAVEGEGVGGSGVFDVVENLVVSALAAEYKYARGASIEPDSREVSTRILLAIADEIDARFYHATTAADVAQVLRSDVLRSEMDTEATRATPGREDER
jgi:hypothetical protein